MTSNPDDQSKALGLSPSDMFRASNLDAFVSDDGKEADGSDLYNVRFQIERFVQAVEKSRHPGFSVKKDRHGNSKFTPLMLARSFYPCIQGYIDSWVPGYFFSPRVELFYSVVQEMQLGGQLLANPHFVGLGSDRLCGDLFNDLVNRIRAGANSRDFKRKLASKERASRRNLKEYIQYFRALMNTYSKLLVLRVDFSYSKEYSHQITFEEVQADLKRFFDRFRARKGIFKDGVGYVRKIEHAEDKGIHTHCIFFLNGADVGDAIGWARKYGDAWQDSLPAGKGVYFSCNAKQRQYKYLGIGRIDHTNFEKRLNFQYYCLAYLVKNEQCLMSKKLKRGRTLARGKTPSVGSGPRLGRPRIEGS